MWYGYLGICFFTASTSRTTCLFRRLDDFEAQVISEVQSCLQFPHSKAVEMDISSAIYTLLPYTNPFISKTPRNKTYKSRSHMPKIPQSFRSFNSPRIVHSVTFLSFPLSFMSPQLNFKKRPLTTCQKPTHPNLIQPSASYFTVQTLKIKKGKIRVRGGIRFSASTAAPAPATNKQKCSLLPEWCQMINITRFTIYFS